MNIRQRTAIELLLSYPDYTVAEMLGVRLITLQRWMEKPEFARALRDREREQARSLGRIARNAALRAAATLAQASSEPSKSDAKVLLDLVKASGAFEPEEEDPGAALAEIVGRLQAEEAAAGGG